MQNNKLSASVSTLVYWPTQLFSFWKSRFPRLFLSPRLSTVLNCRANEILSLGQLVKILGRRFHVCLSCVNLKSSPVRITLLHQTISLSTHIVSPLLTCSHTPNPILPSSALTHIPSSFYSLQDFEGPGMVSCVDQVMGMTLNGDEGEDITFGDTGIPSPYLQVQHSTFSEVSYFVFWTLFPFFPSFVFILLLLSFFLFRCHLMKCFSYCINCYTWLSVATADIILSSLPLLRTLIYLLLFLRHNVQYGADAGGPSSSSASQDDRSRSDKGTPHTRTQTHTHTHF